MKKVILIAAVLLVAIVGLTSYNGKEETKSDDRLIAQIKTTKGDPIIPPTLDPTKKKVD